MQRRPRFCALLVLVLAVAAGLYPARADEAKKPAQDDYELYQIFADTLDQVERNYVKDVSRRELMEAAIHGVLNKLDPYSNYISPEDIGRFKTSVENQFGGIGVQIGTENGQLKIISPLIGTPAYRAGLESGDLILEVDGKSTEDIQIDEAVKRLKGEAGTKVTLTVRHLGSPNKETVTITRELVHVETVLSDRRKADDSWDFMFDRDKHIGYVRISAFSRDTAQDLKKALVELQNDGIKGLILDLRFNPGGLLTSAIEVSDLFVSNGRIVSTKGATRPSACGKPKPTVHSTASRWLCWSPVQDERHGRGRRHPAHCGHRHVARGEGGHDGARPRRRRLRDGCLWRRGAAARRPRSRASSASDAC